MTTPASQLIADPLFVAVTRPPMRFGVTYAAMLLNLIATMELFLLTKNLLTLLVALPVHGVAMLLCARDARFFELFFLWARTSALSWVGNRSLWGVSTYSPLRVSNHARQCPVPTVHV